MKKNKSLKINALLNIAKTILGIIFPIITFPYVSHILSVSSLGAYNFSASIISYIQLIAALGITTYAIREGSQYRNEKYKIEQFVSEVFTINIISTILSIILLVFCWIFIPYIQKYYIMLSILSLQVIFNTVGVNWLCNIYEDFLYITVRTILFQVISLLLMFLLVKTKNDIYIYVVIVTSSSCMANLLNYVYISKNYVHIKFKISNSCKVHLKPILTIFITTVSITVYVSSDVTMLGFMLGDYDVGLYSAAVKMYNIIKNVLVAMVMVMIPRFSILFNTDKENEANILFNNIFKIITLIMLPSICGIICLSKPIIMLIAGNTYIDSSTTLSILSLATFFSLYAYMYINCILIPLKEENIVFKATLVSALTNICLNFFLIPYLGMNAAAITTVIAEMIICIVSYNNCKRYITITKKKSLMNASIGGCVGIVVICYIFQSFIKNNICIVLFSILLSVIWYLLWLLIFNKPLFFSLINVLKKQEVIYEPSEK